MTNGWIKLHRKILENPIFRRPAYMAVFTHLLLSATFDKAYVMFNGKKTKLKPGQFTTGAYQLSVRSGVPRGTVERILNAFKSEELIEKRSDRQCTLITVLNWDRFQSNEEGNGERVRNEWGTSEERVRTKKEGKKEKKERKREAKKISPTPKQIAQEFFDSVEVGGDQYLGLVKYFVAKTKAPEKIITNEIGKFHSYWTEPSHTGKKIRWQMQKTFDVRRRLVTWLNNSNKFAGYEKPEWKKDEEQRVQDLFRQCGLV